MRLTPTLRNWMMAPIAIMLISIVVAAPAIGADPIVGSQGTDTSLPATDSVATVSGRGKFSDLKITVNQTTNLTNQAVSVTWKGGRPTVTGPSRFAGNYLQIFQCWGEPDESVTANPGPPPEQCAQGAVGAVYGGISGGTFPSGYAISRIISRRDWLDYEPGVGVPDPITNEIWRPFRSVDGKKIDSHTNGDFNPSVVGGQFWLNPYYNIVTTNEIGGGATGADGRGAELFEVQTGLQSAGLGCGQRVEPVAGGSFKIPRCWIVVVPRGTPTEENQGTSADVAARPDQFGVFTSPLSPEAWKNRIAIPIEFNPVDSPCSLGAVERRIAGNEVSFAAIESWQPLLCAGGRLPPFSYAPVGDPTARLQLSNPTAGAPGMVVLQRPLPLTGQNPANPVVYAPLTASGLVIGFNVERTPNPSAPPEAQLIQGVRIADIKLTPRLVAKLLTQSYLRNVAIIQPPDYDWVEPNPAHLGADPDFLRFNPEFALLDVLNSRPFSGLQLPAGNSDAAQQIWEWVLADPEARTWLDGQPDEWGMRVNPVYSTTASVNTGGFAFADPPPNFFPKSDPYCYRSPVRPGASFVVPDLCGTDWIPYVRSFAEAAQITRTASDRPRIVPNLFAAAASDAWSRELPQSIGQKTMLAITDSASAAKFGLQVASLSAAGDDGADREFIAPISSSLALGLGGMVAGEVPNVLEPSPLSNPPGAYPLTVLNYAAVAPLSLEPQARAEYAGFLEYALGPGQESGLELGQLPDGYVPLPPALLAQGRKAASTIRTLVATPPVATPPVTPRPVAPPPVVPAPTLSTSTGPSGSVAPPVPPPSFVEPSPGPAASNGSAPRRPTSPSADAPGTIDSGSVPTDTSTPETSTPTSEPVEAQPVEAVRAPTVATASTETGPVRFAVPVMGATSLGAALLALELTKRPRRSSSSAASSLKEPK